MCSCGRSTEYTNFWSDVEGEILIFFLPTENFRCVYGELARHPDRRNQVYCLLDDKCTTKYNNRLYWNSTSWSFIVLLQERRLICVHLLHPLRREWSVDGLYSCILMSATSLHNSRRPYFEHDYKRRRWIKWSWRRCWFYWECSQCEAWYGLAFRERSRISANFASGFENRWRRNHRFNRFSSRCQGRGTKTNKLW